MLLRLAADGDCFVQAFVLTRLLVRCLVKASKALRVDYKVRATLEQKPSQVFA
jgi:hypothetical protein